MRGRIGSLSPRALAFAAIAVVLVYAAAGWLLVAGPKRSEGARLAEDVAAAELVLAEAQASAHRPRGAGVSVSDVLRLARAMPAGGDQAGLVLELAALAKRSRVTLRSVAPQVATVLQGGATAVPVTVTVQGSFFAITRFLRQARGLVDVSGGRIRATGRLFTVQDVELVEAVEKGFPVLDANITMNAFVYSGPIVPSEQERQAEEELQPTGSAAAGGSS